MAKRQTDRQVAFTIPQRSTNNSRLTHPQSENLTKTGITKDYLTNLIFSPIDKAQLSIFLYKKANDCSTNKDF